MKKNRSQKQAVKPAVKKVASKPSAAKSTMFQVPIVIGELPEFVDSTCRFSSMILTHHHTMLNDGEKLAIVFNEKPHDNWPGTDLAIEPSDMGGVAKFARRRKAWANFGAETITLEVPNGQKVANALELTAIPGERAPSVRLSDKLSPPYAECVDLAMQSGSPTVKLSVRNLRAVVDLLERCGVQEACIAPCRQSKGPGEPDAVLITGESHSQSISHVAAIVMGIDKQPS